MEKHLFSLATLILLLLSPKLSFAQEYQIFGVEFPEIVSGYKKGEIKDYEREKKGLGYSISYQSKNDFADIYVYSLNKEFITSNLFDPILKSEFDRCISEILYFVKNIKKEEISLDQKLILQDSTSSPLALFASFNITSSKGKYRSYLYLFGADNHFVKFRISSRIGTNESHLDFVKSIISLYKK